MIGLATGVAALAGFLAAALLGFVVIPFLRKLKLGQSILEDGPQWHRAKQGTPTMGGILLIAGVIAGVALALTAFGLRWPEAMAGETSLQKARLWGGILMALGFGFIGFLDDYIKVVKRRNLGLTARQKLVLQILAATAYAASQYLSGEHTLSVPFAGAFDLGFWMVPLTVFIVVGFVNAVNLTDGIDGLAGNITFLVAVCFILVSGVFNMLGLSMAAAALAGSCLGFLIWNFYPARVFMGDTGSLFLGGMVCALAFGVGQPLLLFPAGVIYVAETASVILQVIYFKISGGKRLFKMSPLHHHFEMLGYSEVKVCALFSIITIIGCAVSVLLVIFGG